MSSIVDIVYEIGRFLSLTYPKHPSFSTATQEISDPKPSVSIKCYFRACELTSRN